MITTILAMACVTFGTRYLFLAKQLPFTIGPKLQRFLSFSAPCVLTAIWVPIVFIQDKQLALTATNPYLVAATVAVLLAFKFKNLYVTTLGSLVIFYMLY
ncbi:AzlD domain-containing protein [Pseudoalteromonas piscicida]|uniref:Branched-chain amino acid ABC transporter n=1 Tax=Pseudoalteromonas piscicida TaxID=43662 RepID=A0A2A5JPD9_PSEO7|nr:AzlD domain-containing protein [Pseudoalteromonas piscicida]PCK31313.1 branched-chain amino acid ABC transporter [Pseudoalteromonas piscicida]